MPERFFGWRVVAAAFAVAAFSYGVGVGSMLFLPPIIAQAEWPPEQVAAVVAANAAMMLLAGALAPAAFGLLRDEFGDWAALGIALVLQLTAALIVRVASGARPPD